MYLFIPGGRPRICTPGVEGNCPKDYICAQGDGIAVPGRVRNLCCHPEKKCIIPFVDVITNHPRRCYPGDSSCPSPTTCLPVLEENATSTNTIDMFICCHNADVYTCPDGDMPLIDHITNRPMRLVQDLISLELAML
uniref:EB domain-containing protein n=1 Tax=Heterorhabditis bacteriophora TaxID=37862 RepID=A0A1I7XR02_HETBA